MPIYKLNGNTYDIPNDKVNDFENDYPDAAIPYSIGDNEYEIPISKRERFLQDYPDAIRSDKKEKPQELPQPYNGDFTIQESELDNPKPITTNSATINGQPTEASTQPAQPKPRVAGKVESVVKAEDRDGVKLRYYEEGGKRIYNPDDVAKWQAKVNNKPIPAARQSENGGERRLVMEIGSGKAAEKAQKPVKDLNPAPSEEQLPMGVTRWQWDNVYTEEQRNEARKRMREQAKMQGAATGVTSGTNQVGDMNVAKSAGEWEGAVSRRQKIASQNAFRNSGGVQAQEAKTAHVQAQQAAVDALPSALTSLKQLEQAGVDANTSLQYNPETGKFENRASMVDVEVKDEEGNNTIVDEEGNTFKDVQDENGNVITAKEQQEAYNYAKAQENIRKAQENRRNARFSREIAAQEEYRRTHDAPTEEPNAEDLEKYPTDQDYYQAKRWWEEITESQQMPEQGKDESRESYLLRVQNYLDRMKRYYEERIEAAPSAATLGSPNASSPYVSALLKDVPTYTEYDVRREYAKWAEDMRDNFPELFDTKTNEAMEILYNPVLRLGRSTAELIANATEMVAGENAVSEGLQKMVDASRERESKRIITNGVADLWDKHGGIVSTAAMGWMGMPLLITTGAGDQAYQARANGASALGATVAGISNALIWTMASKVVGTPLTNRVFNGIGKVQATRAMDYVQKVLGGADKKAAANLKAALESFASLAEKAGKTLQMAETKSVKAHLMQIAAGTFHSTLDMATASALCQFICLYDGEKLMKTDENGNVVEAKGLEKLTEAGKNALVGLKEGAIDGALFGLFFGAFGHGRQMWSDNKSLKDMTRFTPEEVSVASNGKVEGYNPETDVLIGMVGRDSNAPAVLIVGKSGKEGYVKCMLSNGQYVDIPQQNFGLIKKMGKDKFNEMLDNAVQEYYNGDLQAEPDAPASDLVKSKYKYQEALQKMNEVGDWTEEEKVALNGDYKSIGQAIMDGKIEERHVAVVEAYQQALREYSERLYGAKQSVQEATEAYRKELDALSYVEKSGKNPTYIVECEIIKGVREDEEPRRGYVLTGEYEQGDGSVMVLDAETGRKIMMKGEDIRVGNVRRMDRLIEERKAELEQAEAAKIDGDVTSYLTEGAREFPLMIDGETRYAKFIGWDAEGRAVLRLPNGDQFAETRAEVQEQYRNAVLYAARTFYTQDGKLRVTAFDNSEMPEVSGERLEVSGERLEVREESQEHRGESQETSGESRGIDSEAYRSNIPYGDYEQGESYETRVNGEPVTIDIAGVREGDNGEKTYVVEVKDTDMRTIETREMREDELSSLLHPEEAREATRDAMPMREENGKMKADWYAATPERAADYIYKERGWTEQEADEFIRMQREAAEKEADELGKNPPRMELDEDAYDSKKAEWQANMNDAQRRAEHWKNIEQARKNRLAAEAKEIFKEKVDEVNAQETADNGQKTTENGQQNAIGNYEREQGEIEERGGLVRNDSAENNLPAVWRETLHGLGRHIGRKIVIVSEEDAERILGDKDSEGLYDTNTNTIYISEAHIRGNENMLRYVAGHETTHALRSENPEVWNKFVDVVRNAMGKEAFDEKLNEITERYNRTIDRINQNGGLDGRMLNHLSKDAATEEVCAWWSGENILTDIDAARRIIDEAERAGGNPKTIIRKVLDWIDGVLGSLKAALDRGENVQAQYDAVAKAKEMWQDMYNIAAAKETERQTPKNTSIDDAVKFAIKVNHNSPYLLKKADGSFVDPETGERLGFDHRFIGKGEGAQVHGYGSYFSVRDLRHYGRPKDGDWELYIRFKGHWLNASNDDNKILRTTYDLVQQEGTIAKARRKAEYYCDNAKAQGLEEAVNLWKEVENFINYSGLKKSDLRAEWREATGNKHHYAVDIPDDTGTNYIEEEGKFNDKQVATIANMLSHNEDYASAMRKLYDNTMKAYGSVSFDVFLEDAAGVQAMYGMENGKRFYKELSNSMGSEEAASQLLSDIGIVGIHYDGRQDGECYVIFNENDAKITDHIRFSLADKERTLMGVHNISEAKLKKAIKQGGLANPSMAVVDTKQGIHTEYGDISLIPKSELIDTRKGRNAGTYAGDAWTPTYPNVERDLTEQGDKHREAIAKEAAGGDEDMEYHILRSMADYVEGNGDRMHYLFLKQKGLEPEIRYKKTTHTQEEYDAITAIFGEPMSNMPKREEMTKEQNDALVDLMVRLKEEELRETLNKYADKEKVESLIKTRLDMYRNDLTDEEGWLWFSKGDNFIYDNWRDAKRRENPERDWYGTEVDAGNRVAQDGLGGEYESWKENLFDEGDIEEKLFAGWTPSGYRKYVPNTIENASKLMNKEADQNAYDTTGFGATRAMLLQKFKTLDDIRSHKDLIQKGDEAKERTEELSDELLDICNQISDMQKIDDNPFINTDIANRRLQDALLKRDPIDYLNKEYGYSIDKEGALASQIMNFIEDVKNLPARYFETKFKRPVGLDEFAVAVVPEGTSAEVTDALKEAGLEVHTYAKDENDQHRTAAVMNAVSKRDDIMFSFAGIKGATNADKAEGVETRMMALGTAKQMEEDGRSALDTKIATGWERGKDGKWRYEMPDLKLHLSQYYTGTTKLSEIADAPELFAAYPSMEDIEVEVFDNPLTGTMGATSVKRVKDSNQFGTAKANIDKFPTYESYLSTLEARREKYLKQINEKERPEEYEDVKDILDNAIASSKAEYDRWANLVEHADDIDKITISLNNAATRSAKESVEKTLIHEVQHVIQEIEGFAKGGNVKSILNDEEVRNVFIKELQDRRGNAEAILEDAKQSGDEERIKVAQSIVDKWDSVAKDFMNGDVSAEKAFEMYQRIAGEVEARNAAERSGMTPEERRRSLAEDTEDYYRGEQIVTYGDTGESASIVAKDKADELEKEPKVKVYRAMQLRDGKLYPPMAGRINGEWQNPIELGVWEQADEHPELATNGKFKLDKGNGSTLNVAYNPYLHTSRSPLNDQFSSAWSRPELVTVEVEVPESELTSGYKAEGAKDAVGEVEWKSGVVSSQLAKQGNPRKVILSRYDKPIRIVPTEEVAERIAEMLKGKDIEIPFNTVTPELREALEAQGVKIGEPQKGNAGAAAREAYDAWKNGNDVRFSVAEKDVREKEDKEFNRLLDTLTEDNKDSVILYLGRPSQILLDAGIEDKQMKLYGNKLMKKKKLHGFELDELHNLPSAVADPIAVFNNHKKEGNRSILVELKTKDGNFLASVDIGDGVDIDFNIITTVFGKGDANINEWFKSGYATYINEKKVKDFLSYQSAPIAAASAKSSPNSAANIDNLSELNKHFGEKLYVRTKNFKNWFGDWEKDPENSSKIVDNNGEPLVVYHTSPNKFTAFDKSKVGNMYKDKLFDLGFYFTNDKNISYGDNKYEVFLDIKNPLVVKGEGWGSAIDQIDKRVGEIRKAIKEGSYDGVIVESTDEILVDENGKEFTDKVFVALEPTQIKSATENVGTFDKENPDIRFSIGGRVEPRDVKEVAAEVMSEGKMLWENTERDGATLKGVAAETGYGEGEKKRLFGLFRSAEKGGKSVDEIAHQVMELCNDLNIPCDGTDEAKAAVLDVLSESEKMSDIRNYARNRRMAEADEQTRHEMEQEQAHRDQHYMDEYGMTEEEYQDYLHRTTAEMMSGSEADREEIANLRTEKEKLEARLAKQKEQSDMGSPLVAFLNDQISGFKAEIERIKEESSARLAGKQEVISGLRGRLSALKRSRLNKMKSRLEVLKQVREGMSDEGMSSIDLERKQRIDERLQNLDAVLNSKTPQVSARVMETELRDLEIASLKEGLVKFIERQMNVSWMPYVGKKELNAIVSEVSKTRRPDQLEEARAKVQDIIVDVQLKKERDRLKKLESLKGSKVDQRGVVVQGQLDKNGQTIMNTFKKYRRYSSDDIDEAISDAIERMGNNNSAVADEAANEYAGLQMAKEYSDKIRQSEHDEDVLCKEMKQVYEDTDEAYHRSDEYKQYVKSMEEAIRQNKSERLQSYAAFLDKLSNMAQESRGMAKAFIEQNKQRVRDIQHLANSDMEGMELRGHRADTKLDRLSNSAVPRYLLSSLPTFNNMLQLFGRRNADGQGYLWDRFMRQWQEASDGEQAWREHYHELMDKKMAELYGKGKKFEDLTNEANVQPSLMLTYRDSSGEMREFELTQTQMLYLYGVDKMPMGRATNRKMGFTDDVMEKIANTINPRLREFADWVQSELLPELGSACNEVHKRMFGANMDSIENYFPFVRDTEALNRQAENGEDSQKFDRISTTTGAIKRRTANTVIWDLPNASYPDVLSKHIQQMCQWGNFAEFNRDLSALISYNRFKEQVKSMNTIYGSGNELWRTFKDVAAIAGGAYTPKAGRFDNTYVRLMKGVAMSKIAFRVHTATKQVLSNPAFWGDVDAKYMAEAFKDGGVGAFKWAMENMPNFRKRIKSRTSGEYRLQDEVHGNRNWADKAMQKAQVGMLPNIGVDAWTIATGAWAKYKTQMDIYRDRGMSEEAAHKRAIQDAEICYNKSQQSSEGAFLAPIQVDRTAEAVAAMLFRTASTSYTRETLTSARNLKRIASGEVDVDFMTKQILRQMEIKDISGRFDEELEKQASGEITVGETYQLGKPSGILQSAGFSDIPIEMSHGRLAEISEQNGIPVESLRGFVQELNRPLAVYDYGDGTKDVIISMRRDGKQSVMLVHIDGSPVRNEVTDIRELGEEWLNRLGDNKASYLDHDRLTSMIAERRAEKADENYLSDVAEMVSEHKNNDIPEQKVSDKWRDEDWDWAREEAMRELKKAKTRNLTNLAVYGWVLPWLWRIGSTSMGMWFMTDKKKKWGLIKDAFTHSIFSPLEGLVYGDVMTDLINVGIDKIMGAEDASFKNIGRTNPFNSDMSKMLSMADRDMASAGSEILKTLIAINTGVDPQTIIDWVAAILDYAGSGNKTDRNEMAIFASRIMSVPQKQLDEMYLNEINMSGKDAAKLTPDELAERYARYKVMRGYPFMPWLWSNEGKIEKQKEKFIKTIKDMLKETGNEEAVGAYKHYEEVYKGIDARLKEAKKIAKKDKEEGERLIKEIESDSDYRTYETFKKLNKNLTSDGADLTKKYLESGTTSEATICLNAINTYRQDMVDVMNAESDAARRELTRRLYSNLWNSIDEYTRIHDGEDGIDKFGTQMKVLNQYLSILKTYEDERANVKSMSERKAYEESHPELEIYEDLKTIKDAISRWRKDAREGDVTPEEAAESIKNELGKIKM